MGEEGGGEEGDRTEGEEDRVCAGCCEGAYKAERTHAKSQAQHNMAATSTSSFHGNCRSSGLFILSEELS